MLLVIGALVIGADAHIIGYKILQIALKEAGFNVAGPGNFVPQEEFIKAAIETNAKAISISSLYGMGKLDCYGFREKCIEAGLKDMIVNIGGNLGLGKKDWNEVEKILLDVFNRNSPPGTTPEVVIKVLDADLKR